MHKPLGKRVLVKPHKLEEKVNGIILPTKTRPEHVNATVIELGTANDFVVKKGDTVMMGFHAGHDIDIGGEKYTIVSEDNLMCVISEV